MEDRLRLTEEELGRLDLLRGIEPDSVQGMLEHCPVREIRKGEILIRAGSSNEYLYLLVSGRLRIHLVYDDEPVAVLEAGEAVGEISLIDGHPTTAYVVADTDSRLLQMDAHVLWSLVQGFHAAAFNLLLLLAQRLRRGNSVITKTRELQKEWERYATIDCLTGLYNRRWLDSTIPKLIQRCRFANKPFSVIAIDIDHFKEFNDTYGHQAGDRAIYTVGSALGASMRPGDMVARYGGDEFLALLPEADLAVAADVARRLHACIPSQPRNPEPQEPAELTISLGMAEMQASDTAESLVRSADKALYCAKLLGRNRICSGSDESDRALGLSRRAARAGRGPE
jgi:diguanylate cyclase (GGDEF)-like protein